MKVTRRLATAAMFSAMFFTACENNNEDAFVESLNSNNNKNLQL